jgi:hypothetical protein
MSHDSSAIHQLGRDEEGSYCGVIGSEDFQL